MNKKALKIGISIFFCVLLYRIGLTESAFYSSLAVVMTFQNSVYASFKAGENRMKGTFLGAVIGVLFAVIGQSSAVLSGVGVSLIIILCNSLNWKKSINIACIVFIAIMVNIEKLGISPIEYSLQRVFETLLGIIIALTVNYLIFPEKYEWQIYTHVRSTFRKIKNLFIEKYYEKSFIKLFEIKKDIDILENLLKEYKREKRLKKSVLDIEKVNYILTVLKRICFHLDIINGMNSVDNSLNKENIKRFKYLFGIDLDGIFVEKEEAVAYNYHTKLIIDDIVSLEDLRFNLKLADASENVSFLEKIKVYSNGIKCIIRFKKGFLKIL